MRQTNGTLMVGGQLDRTILEVISNLGDSVFLRFLMTWELKGKEEK